MTAVPYKARLYGLATVLGLARRGYFTPYRYAHLVPPDRTPYPWLEARFSKLLCAGNGAGTDAGNKAGKAGETDERDETGGAGNFTASLAKIAAYRDRLLSFAGPPPMPRWNQDWFPGLDGAAAYGLIRAHRPARIFEIGSGHSTRFVMQAISDGGFACEVTCIDPAPRADIAALPITLIRRPVQDVMPDQLPALTKGDALLIDSSHIAVPGSDVDWVLNRFLPTLPAGVLVHIHDMFLPDPYPRSWDWRGYNEQMMVAALLAGGRAEPLLSNHYMRTRGTAALQRFGLDRIPLGEGAIESGLWLRLRA